MKPKGNYGVTHSVRPKAYKTKDNKPMSLAHVIRLL